MVLIHRKKEMKKAILVIAILLIPIASYSQEIGDYLIREDIGSYKRITKGGPSGNILAGAKHFGADHTDGSYGIAYVNNEDKMWVDVQVTQHAGGDSDKWLLHEVEDSYRDADTESLGLLTGSTILRKIGGNRLLYLGLGGGSFSWISNNVVVEISYTDLQGTKPEPLEVVQAYLQKFPSTIPTSLVLDKAHDELWIKDEMERRLWLCDKWQAELQAGKAQISHALEEIVENLEVFLDYREKYYGISAGEEKQIFYGYLQALNGTEIRKKLTGYKQWWTENQTKPINLP